MKARSLWPAAFLVVWVGCAGAVSGGDPGVTTGAAGTAGVGPGAGAGGTAGTITGVGGSVTGVGGGGVTGVGGIVGTSPVVTMPTWRLSNAEYANTVRELLGAAGTLTVALDPDSSSGGFRTGGVASDNTVRTYRDAAVQLATQAMTNLAQLVPCVPTAGDAACATKFIDSFAPRAFRRPLDPTQRTALIALYNKVATMYGFSSGIQALLEAILQSPNFVYHLEIEEQGAGVGLVPVAGYSMANRLSYLLWTTMPDAALTAKAAANQLSTKEQVIAQARLMIADPKARSGLANFYDQWLGAMELPPSKNGSLAAIYTPAAAADIRASFKAQIDDALWADRDTVKNLLTSRNAFVNATLAPLFGVTGITGTNLQKVPVNAQQRAGVLTHPALMALLATETESHPVKRGVFTWETFLCQPLPDPPPGAGVFVEPPPGVSTRKQYETLTAAVSCQGCHKIINPVGFLFESYDAVGRYRTIDDRGQPVDTAGTVAVGNASIDGPVTSVAQFVDRIAGGDSGVTQCFVNHLYRYATKRPEAAVDQPALDGLHAAFLQTGQNAKELLVALTQTEAFLFRRNVQ